MTTHSGQVLSAIVFPLQYHLRVIGLGFKMNRRRFLKLLGMTPLAIVFPSLLTHVTAGKTAGVVKNLHQITTSYTTSTSSSSSSSTTIDRSKISVFDEYKWEERY